MPSLGADMEEGTLLEWLVSPGDTVRQGDLVAVVDTAKAAVEVETFRDGVVTELLVPVGTTVPVGTVLAHLSDIDAETPAVAPAPPSPEPAPPTAPPTAARPEVVSPLVRRLAHDLGVDLAEAVGTGAHGQVTREDVQRAATAKSPEPGAAAAPVPREGTRQVRITPYARRLAHEGGLDVASVTPADGEIVRAGDVRRATGVTPTPPITARSSPLPRPPARAAQMREAIARTMARSKREIPHYYLGTTVDLSGALSWMRDRNRDLMLAERLVPAALLLRATAVATARHPEFNGFWVDDAFQPGSGVHLGVAISLRGGGLVAPALHDADRLSVEQTMAGVRDLVTRARAGRLRGAELTDATLTVTNLGEQGVETVYGVIHPPQVALVGFGRIVDRAVAVDGLLGIRPVTTLTLSADHRATDGFGGGRLLATIVDVLQNPEEL